MTLTRWNPVAGLAAVEIDSLNRMFEQVFGATNDSDSTSWSPAVDIYEKDNKDVVLKVELPSMKREDIKVTFENDVLTIEGDRAFPTDVPREKYHRLERQYGTFRRSFTLPKSVDGATVQAAYQDGMLTITMPQREDAKPRTIQING